MTERDSDRTAQPHLAAQSGRTKPDAEPSEPAFVVRDKRRKPSPRPRSDSAAEGSAAASGEADVPEETKASTPEQRHTTPRSGHGAAKDDTATTDTATTDAAKDDKGKGDGGAKHARPEPETAGGFAAEAQALRTELDERTRDLQRLTAEYANYRRRIERDRALAGEQATASVLVDLLGVLDDLDRARDHGDLVGPFGAVADQLVSVLTKLGLEPFGESGDEFDPNRHEAVAHSLSSEVTEPTCVQVFRRGYLYGERLLRPALVAVADPTGEEPAEPAPEAEPALQATAGHADNAGPGEADPETVEVDVVEAEVVDGDVVDAEAAAVADPATSDAGEAAEDAAAEDSYRETDQPAATTEKPAPDRTGKDED